MKEGKGLRDIELRVLSELMKSSRRSDRELAKLLNVSQPTVTRSRAKLEKEGYVIEYTVIPNLVKLGYDILAITLVKLKEKLNPQQVEGMRKKALRLSKTTALNCIVAVSTLGSEYDGILVSVHKSYSDYLDFKQQITRFAFGNVENVQNILLSLTGDYAYRGLTFSTLADHILKSGKGSPA